MSPELDQPELFEKRIEQDASRVNESAETDQQKIEMSKAAEIINSMAEDYYNRHEAYVSAIKSYEPNAYYDLGYEDPNMPQEPVVDRNILLIELRAAGEFKLYNAIRNRRLGNLFVRLEQFGNGLLANDELDESEKREEEIKKFNEAAQEVGLPSAYSFMQLAYLMEHFPAEESS